jgi:hypothetical protein
MYDGIIELIDRANVRFPRFGNGVSSTTIEAAERSLGIALPESYKWWLLNYGGGQIRGEGRGAGKGNERDEG